MWRGIPRSSSSRSHRCRSSSVRPGALTLFGRSRIKVGHVRSPSFAVAKAVLILARSIGNRRVDEHPDLTARVHHVLTDGLLALERIDDIVKPALTINF